MKLTDAIEGWLAESSHELPSDRQALVASIASRLRAGRHHATTAGEVDVEDLTDLVSEFADHERAEVGAVVLAGRAWAMRTNPASVDVDRPDKDDRLPAQGPIAGAVAPAAGWWQASDDHWYPPEDHPDFRTRAPDPVTPPDAASHRPRPSDDSGAIRATPAPVTQPPASQPPPPRGQHVAAKPAWPRRVGAIAAAAIALVALVAFRLIAAGDDDRATVSIATDIEVPAPPPIDQNDDEPDDDTEPTIADTATGPGSRDNPFPTGEPRLVRLDSGGTNDSLWEITVSDLRDVTDAVLDENPFNEPPPDGVRYVGFDLAMTLVDTVIEPITPGFSVGWTIIGGDSRVIHDEFTIDTDSFGCGVVPDEYDEFGSVVIGGTLRGTVCLPMSVDDLTHPDSAAALRRSNSDFVVFAASGLAASDQPREESETLSKVSTAVGALGRPHGFDTPVTVAASRFSDERFEWRVTVSAPSDITQSVLDENDFNDPPPPGHRYLGFDVTIELLAADSEPASPVFDFSWEYVGATSGLVYDEFGSGEADEGCGVVPGEFDDFAELLVGGKTSGTICIPVQVIDFNDARSLVSLHLDKTQQRLGFAPAD